MKKLLSLLLLFSIATPALAAVTILPSFSGGTGFGTYAQGDIIYASALNTLNKLTIGNSGQCLTSNGTTPGWGACSTSSGGAGTWATTTSTVTNHLLNYPLNTTDIVIIGSTSATSSSKFYFDPSLSLANILGTASTTNLVVVNNSTTTNATSTNFFSTTASTSNLFAANIQGAGLATCNGSTSGLSWAAGLFGCVTITPVASSITGGQALTKTDDTNVTLTLGGAPSTSLLSATSLTLGWTGTLADSRVADNLTISGGTVDNSVIGGTTKATGSFTNLLASASSTLQNFTGLNSTTTNSTSTAFAISGIASGNCLQTSTGGAIISAGAACGSGSGGAAYPFQGSNNSTSTLVGFTGGLYSNASSSFQSFTGTNATTTNATTTGFAISGVGSAILLTNSGGSVSGYGGASACASNNFVTTISSLGATTCGTSTISGVSLGGTLNALTATNSTLTFSGNFDGSTARTVGLNLGTSNTWTSASTIFNNYVGIGTTTPQWALQIASSTAPQLTLSTGIAGNDHLSFRFTGSTFYIASSSNLTFATATTPLLSVDETQPAQFGFGTTSTVLGADLMYLFKTSTTTLEIDSNSITQGACIALKDTDGVGYTYVYGNNGSLTASTVSCK